MNESVSSPEQQERMNALHLASPENFDGLFWASPDVLQKWANRINSVELSTMSIGAISHEKDLGELSDRMLQLLRPATPLHSDVLRAGLMYGNVVANESIRSSGTELKPHGLKDSPEDVIINNAFFISGFLKSWYSLSNIVFPRTGLQTPQAQEHDADTSGAVTSLEDDMKESTEDTLEVTDVDDVRKITMAGINVAFMQIRQLEVDALGSDILASTFGVVQDHMANQVFKNTDAESEYMRANIASDAQLLFYVGALCGALKRYFDEGVLPKPPTQIELHRGIKDAETVYSAVVEYEASDNITELIRYSLEHKYVFGVAENVKSGGGKKARRAIEIYPNGLQMGPNKFQVPGLGIQMPWQTMSYKDVEHCVFQQTDPETREQRFMVLPADDNTWNTYLKATDLYKLPAEWQLCSVVLDKDMVISRIDIAHPSAVALDQFIAKQIGQKPGTLRYANELQGYEVTGVPRAARKLNRFVMASAMGGPVFVELTDRLEGKPGNPVATIVSMAIGGGVIALINKFTKGVQPSYDTISYDDPANPKVEETIKSKRRLSHSHRNRTLPDVS